MKQFLPQTKATVVSDHGLQNRPGLLERVWAYIRIRHILEGGHCMCGKKQQALQLALKVSFHNMILQGAREISAILLTLCCLN